MFEYVNEVTTVSTFTTAKRIYKVHRKVTNTNRVYFTAEYTNLKNGKPFGSRYTIGGGNSQFDTELGARTAANEHAK